MSDFFEKCAAAGNDDFKNELCKIVEGLGTEFLRIIEDEIIRLKVIDTRLLLSGFHKGDSNNIWEISDGGLTLTVGTNVEYAAFVNDGHWTCGHGKDMRFVPGDVVTDSSGKIKEFHYNKNAKTGMMLKQKFVKGKHYWESGIRIMEKILPGVIEAKMQEWLDSYFGGD